MEQFRCVPILQTSESAIFVDSSNKQCSGFFIKALPISDVNAKREMAQQQILIFLRDAWNFETKKVTIYFLIE